MKNFTLEQKFQLKDLVEAGAVVTTVAYNPHTIDVIPSAPEGFTVFYREDSAELTEIIYLKAK